MAHGLFGHLADVLERQLNLFAGDDGDFSEVELHHVVCLDGDAPVCGGGLSRRTGTVTLVSATAEKTGRCEKAERGEEEMGVFHGRGLG